MKSRKQFEEDIRLMAYYLWEEKGSNNGADVEDWIAAETNCVIELGHRNIGSKTIPQGVAFFSYLFSIPSCMKHSHNALFQSITRVISAHLHN